MLGNFEIYFKCLEDNTDKIVLFHRIVLMFKQNLPARITGNALATIIGHFRVAFCLCFKARSSAKPLI